MALFLNVHHRGQPNLLIKSDRFSDSPASIKEECICDKLKQKTVTKDINVPVVQPAPYLLPFGIDNREVTVKNDLCRQIGEENNRRIGGISEERSGGG